MMNYSGWTNNILYEFKVKVKALMFDKYPQGYECLISMATVEKFI